MEAESPALAFPRDWQLLPVEACVIPDGFERKPSVQQSDYKPTGRFPVIDQGSSLIAGYTDEEALVHRRDLPLILFGDHTRVFKFLDFPFATGADGTKLLRADERMVHPRFLYYALLHVDIPSRGYSRHFKYLREKTIATPIEFDEQRAIAGVLSRLQAAVEIQERIVAALKELKAATMAKLFREGLCGEPLKQTQIGEIPASWEVMQLGAVATIERGKFAHRPRNEPRFYGGTVPFIQTGDVARSNGWIRSYTQTLNEAGLAISRKFPKGTIVLTIAANIADIGVLEFDSAFPDSLVGITPDATMDTAFLAYYLCTQKSEMDRLAPKGTQKNINIQFLNPWPTPRPTLVEQQGIAKALHVVDERLEVESRRLEAMRSLFRAMLQRLMTAEVRVPAETLSVREGRAAAEALERRARDRKPGSERIEHFVKDLVCLFEPDRAILFGERAEGSPKAFGEIGLLVEMDFAGLARNQAARIAQEIPHDFSLDLVVRRPGEVTRAIEAGDRFIGAIVEKGRVLYERPPAEARPPEAPVPEARAGGRPRRTLSEETLAEIVRRIVEAVQPEQIVLFGSAARGEMGPDSDVDLLVVKGCSDRRETARTIRERLIGVTPGLPKDVIVVTPEEVDRHRDTIGLIIRPALREGRVVYAG